MHILKRIALFVILALAMGVGGLLAWVWLAAACIALGLRRLRAADSATAWMIEAGLASLLALLAHGLVDDALYGSRGLLLMLVPLGVVMGSGGFQISNSKFQISEARSTPATLRSNLHAFRSPLHAFAALVSLVALVALAALNRRPILAAFYANLGAVEQARAELSVYDPAHFDQPTLDQVRQQQDLDGAILFLERAAQIDPANPTARQRLAAMALSRGQYEAAWAQMQAAWQAGHRDSVTRLLLGDAYAANGQPEQAAEVTSGLRWAANRLHGQAWYRYWLGQDYARAAVLLLDPTDKQAAAKQTEATRRAGQK